MLAQIISMVQDAQGSKAPVQKLVDKIAGIFVPVVISIAILTFILWLILGGDHGVVHGLLAAVTVLVIACPCALRSEEHTSELQSLMRISYAVFCLKKKN